MPNPITAVLIALAMGSACSSGAVAQNADAGTLRALPNLREGVTRGRSWSFDTTGGNNDRVENILPGARRTLADIRRPGTITHLWLTFGARAWWNHSLTTAVAGDINLDGKDNYLTMDATGHGQYIGVVMHVQGYGHRLVGRGRRHVLH